MDSVFFLASLSALTVIALVASGVSLFLHLRTGSVHQLQSLVRQLELDLHDLFDTVEKWTRRDRVRRLRDGREAAADQVANVAALPPRGTPEYKAALRAKLNQRSP